MSAVKIKNLNRRLDFLECEASSELNSICGNDLWKSLGFVVFDDLKDASHKEKANYYFGQLQVVREIKASINN